MVKLKMTVDITSKYQEAIIALNTLQSNVANLKSSQNQPRRGLLRKLLSTKTYLNKCGVNFSSLEGKVIHVAGTKGKGSTTAFCESLLRSTGLKTGFYSSPHLIEVRERIRINGVPLSKEQFTDYFWSTYTPLQSSKMTEDDMPAYFKFLTILAFKVFIEEKVDVAVVEVGIGGEYDCTNIFKNTVAGITSMGYDHMDILGNTLEEITWHKAGIFKEGCIAWTYPQAPEVFKLLKERSEKKNCILKIAPLLTELNNLADASAVAAKLGRIQTMNASLAIQLVNSWLTNSSETCLLLTQSAAQSLLECCWPGRYQKIQVEGITFFLDGAHTEESTQICANWFQESVATRDEKKVLIFNTTGRRDMDKLLTPFLTIGFDNVFFCPNVVSTTISSPGRKYFTVPFEAHKFNQKWSDTTSMRAVDVKRSLKHKEVWNSLGGTHAEVCDSVHDAVNRSKALGQPSCILVTGSLHLVGALLSFLKYQV